jgi:hypothetical protein
VTTIAGLLTQVVPLEAVQYLAGHSSSERRAHLIGGTKSSRGTTANESQSKIRFKVVALVCAPLLSDTHKLVLDVHGMAIDTSRGTGRRLNDERGMRAFSLLFSR